jgi:two-component system nitrate/nitrite response regulator NarL
MNAERGGHVGASAPRRNGGPEDPAGPQALRIFVLGETRIYREALVSSLRSHGRLEPVGGSDCAQAAARIREARPDIILIDAGLLTNPDLAQSILSAAPQAKTVALGVSEADHAVLSCAAAGVTGFAPRDASAEELVAIIEGVTRNELVCSPRMAASIYHRLSVYCGRGPRPGSLTRRELQIIGLVDKGCSNKEISRQLSIGTATVKNHVHHILEKLDVHRRGEAAARVRREMFGLPRDQTRPN